MILKILLFPFEVIIKFFIYLYKFLISPFLPNTCIYYPTCSTYTLLSIKEHGLIKGIILGTKRIFRCTPKHSGKVDLVPLNIKGDHKWIF